MANPRIKDVLRPLLLCDEHVESRTTLIEGGGADVARPTVVTTSRSPTYAKSSWTPKVNPFLYASPLPTLLNGMLLHTPSHMHDRFTLTSTEAREEARSIKPDKTEAWKRRRKKTDRQMLSVASGTTGPGDRYYRPVALPPSATASNRRRRRKPQDRKRYYRS